jgi:carbon-monoxide dehydrogenase medium subunit
MNFGLSGIPAFDYHQPASLKEALVLLDAQACAQAYLGGTDLFPRIRSRQSHPQLLVDLKSIQDFPATQFTESGELQINPQTSLAHLLPWLQDFAGGEVLSSAILQLGTPSLRNRATLAGNLCNASPAADSIAPLMTLNSRVVLQSSETCREVLVEDLMLSPGKTICWQNELLTAIILPAQPANSRGVYLKIGRNRAADLSICGVAVLVSLNDKNNSGVSCRIVVSGANPIPIKISAASEFLAGHLPDQAAFEHAARLASQAVQPISDLRSSAAYRQAMVYELTLQALTACFKAFGEKTFQ